MGVLRMLEIIEHEFDGDPHLAQRVFHDGFQAAVLTNDLDLAGTFMHRAYEARIIAEGEHAKAAELKRYADDPSSHPLAITVKSSVGPDDVKRDGGEDDMVCQPCLPLEPIASNGPSVSGSVRENVEVDLAALD